MNGTSLRRCALLSIALGGLALAGCANQPSRVAGLAGSPIPAATAATTPTTVAPIHSHPACTAAGGIQCERAFETGYGAH